MKVRRRSKFGNTIVQTIQNFRKHRTGRNAALVGHYGFLSVFPLLLVFTTVLGFVLQSKPRLREEIIDSAFDRIPIIDLSGMTAVSKPRFLIKGSKATLVKYGLDPQDELRARRNAEMAYEAVWQVLSEWDRVRAVFRWSL